MLDPDGRPPAEELAARRWLSWRSDADGMQVGRLVLDPDAAAIVQTALASLAAPSSTAEVRDDRDGPQRHADALVELARRSLLTGRRHDPRRNHLHHPDQIPLPQPA